MTLEELQESANRDLKIDDTDLGTESINIPILHNKYLQHYNKFSLLLKKAEYEQKVLKQHMFYMNSLDSATRKLRPIDSVFDYKVSTVDASQQLFKIIYYLS